MKKKILPQPNILIEILDVAENILLVIWSSPIALRYQRNNIALECCVPVPVASKVASS